MRIARLICIRMSTEPDAELKLRISPDGKGLSLHKNDPKSVGTWLRNVVVALSATSGDYQAILNLLKQEIGMLGEDDVMVTNFTQFFEEARWRNKFYENRRAKTKTEAGKLLAIALRRYVTCLQQSSAGTVEQRKLTYARLTATMEAVAATEGMTELEVDEEHDNDQVQEFISRAVAILLEVDTDNLSKMTFASLDENQ
ncbi:MAG: hypothetical protein COB29_13195, partial [Sulfitobacter sp.]